MDYFDYIVIGAGTDLFINEWETNLEFFCYRN